MKETRPARPDHGAYVRKVQEDTQSFAKGLIGEVERLRVQVAALESEKAALAAQAREIETMVRANDALRAQMEGIKAETQAYSSRYAAVEQQNSNLANLYVASYRLHGTLDRKEVIDTLQEIIANLIGSEEAGLYELNAAKQSLELVASFGLAPDAHRSVSLASGRLGQAARSGEIFVAEPGSGEVEGGLTACIPLKLDGKVTGAMAIYRLLPQKSGFEEVDRELFELLATHAATALYCTSLHARLQAQEVVR